MIQAWYNEQLENQCISDIEDWSASISKYNENDFPLRSLLTATRWHQLADGKISLEDAKKYAISRKTAALRKQCEADKARVAEWLKLPNVESVVMVTTWKNHKPSVDASVHLADGHVERYEGHAGGCGYDLESAAVAMALNQCGAIRKALIEAKFNKGADGKTNHEILGYGSGYGIIPHFEGGVGITSHKRIFETMGFNKVGGMSGKTYDLIILSSRVGGGARPTI